jgi:ParB-like chromosome segregation protein Spo0J
MQTTLSRATVAGWSVGEVRPLPLAEIGEHYRRYRLPSVRAEQAMVRSLRGYGQIAPIVVCLREERAELLDGFTRLGAARALKGMDSLSARLIEADERSAKAAVYRLNQFGRRPQELEEGWIVHALVREDGLSQLEVAQLLGRHRSWVCRRLALVEKLSESVKEHLRLGLVPLSTARELTQLPVGNQEAVLTTARRESLSGPEVRAVVQLLVGAANAQQVAFVLSKPREALGQSRALVRPNSDPRLSSGANQIWRRLGWVLDGLGRMEAWLHHRGWSDLTMLDRQVLAPSFKRLSRDGRIVAELVEDLMKEPQVK